MAQAGAAATACTHLLVLDALVGHWSVVAEAQHGLSSLLLLHVCLLLLRCRGCGCVPICRRPSCCRLSTHSRQTSFAVGVHCSLLFESGTRVSSLRGGLDSGHSANSSWGVTLTVGASCDGAKRVVVGLACNQRNCGRTSVRGKQRVRAGTVAAAAAAARDCCPPHRCMAAATGVQPARVASPAALQRAAAMAGAAFLGGGDDFPAL